MSYRIETGKTNIYTVCRLLSQVIKRVPEVSSNVLASWIKSFGQVEPSEVSVCCVVPALTPDDGVEL